MNANDRPKAAARAAAVDDTPWRRVRRPPRTLWVRCWQCRTSAISEGKHLRGWVESAALPRVYLCPRCAEQVGS